MDTKYNGWTNYETWCAKLWIDNDQSIQEMWDQAARDMLAEPPASEVLTPEESALYGFTDALKAYYEGNVPEMENSVYYDLLCAALKSVNWREIAGNIMGGLTERA